MNPSVSLLVPAFNRADLIGACIDSALNQTVPDLEVVVVDGASTDGTWELCQQYAAADPRVRIWREDRNEGPVRGWWKCVELARGRFATFLWSDDLLMPSFIERTMPFLMSDDVAFAYTAAEIGPEPGRGKVAYALRTQMITGDAFVVGSLTSRGQFPVSPACALFRLSDIRQHFRFTLPTHPEFDLTRNGAGTDVLLLLGAAASRPRVAHVSQPLSFFRSHPGSISVQARDGQVTRGYAMTKAWFAREYGRPDLIPSIVALYWLGDMVRTRRFVSPWAAAHSYGDSVSPISLLVGAIRVAARLVADRIWSKSARPA